MLGDVPFFLHKTSDRVSPTWDFNSLTLPLGTTMISTSVSIGVVYSPKKDLEASKTINCRDVVWFHGHYLFITHGKRSFYFKSHRSSLEGCSSMDEIQDLSPWLWVGCVRGEGRVTRERVILECVTISQKSIKGLNLSKTKTDSELSETE